MQTSVLFHPSSSPVKELSACRSAIIDEFRLNDTLTGGRVRAPVHNSNDIMG